MPDSSESHSLVGPAAIVFVVVAVLSAATDGVKYIKHRPLLSSEKREKYDKELKELVERAQKLHYETNDVALMTNGLYYKHAKE